MPEPVNTKTVKGRRALHFTACGQVIDHAVELAALERDGRLRALGNWTLGQTCGHLAAWVSYAYDGPPFKPSWLLRLVGPLVKKRVLSGMPVGTNIPGAPGGTYGTERITTEEGLGKLQREFARLLHTPPTKPSPVFGPLTPEEWQALHLRHAELHLSFFVQADAPAR